MEQKFIRFFMKKHRVNKQIARFFWLYFMDGKYARNYNYICNEMNIRQKQYKTFHYALKHNLIGKRAIIDFYTSLHRNWRKYTKHCIPRPQKKDFAKLIIKSDLKCCYCGVSQYDMHKGLNRDILTIEHVENYTFTDINNFSLACHYCNTSKGNRIDAKHFKSKAKAINSFWRNTVKVKAIFPERSSIWK